MKLTDLNENYNLLGYHKKRTLDAKGDLTLVEYFEGYDQGTDTYSELRVEEVRTYSRNATTGLLESRSMTVTWYEAEDELQQQEVIGTKTTVKYYDATQGFVQNQRSRRNLTDKASMYLLSQVGLVDAKAFWKTVASEVEDYREVGDMALITSIADSTESYITPTIKGTLDVILNISYTA